jgi:hypothetical protein
MTKLPIKKRIPILMFPDLVERLDAAAMSATRTRTGQIEEYVRRGLEADEVSGLVKYTGPKADELKVAEKLAGNVRDEMAARAPSKRSPAPVQGPAAGRRPVGGSTPVKKPSKHRPPAGTDKKASRAPDDSPGRVVTDQRAINRKEVAPNFPSRMTR